MHEVSSRESYVGRLEALLQQVRARRATGRASASDVAQVEARLAGARADLAGVRADLETSRAALTEATGLHPARRCRP